MPRFTTISPTCCPGGKPDGWDRFRKGGYIAIGWCYETDLTGMSIDEILPLLPGTSASDRDQRDGEHSFPIFWELCARGAAGAGDYIAVRNTNDGLFGVGIIRSGYKYSRFKHDTDVPNHYYPHFVDVEWIHDEYIPRSSLDFAGEKSWVPFGTIGRLHDDVPNYLTSFLQLNSAI
ncbi:MAG: hypothetical protein WD049_02475 [Candidatus Paceibacterota bacterium]